MKSIDLRHRRRILGFSDTYGIDAGNGVARFLQDLRQLADQNQLPLEMVVPARDEISAGLIPIRAPAFSVPGYGELKLSMPLRHHRKHIERHIKSTRPDCLHVSTPGPLGCFGLTMARRYRIPLVGIYHTDFASYARAIVTAQLTHLRQNPQQLIAPASAKVLPWLLPLLGQLSATHPQAVQDLSVVGTIINRNFQSLATDSRVDEYIGTLAEKAATSLLRRFYAYFDLIIARSSAQECLLAEQLDVDPRKIQCLRPGTDVDRFHPKHADRTIWSQYDVPDNAFVVIYVGRITAEKNVGFLRDIWAQIQSQRSGRDLRLVVVGEGDPKFTSRLRELQGVHLIGAQCGDALSRIYASADLLVFPSNTETLGQVGLEAGASGLPAMVSDRGGPQMYIQNGQTGWVLPTSEPSVWCDRVLTLTGGTEELRNIGGKARTHIVNNFTLNHSLQSYWELHDRAILQRKKKSKSSGKARVTAHDLLHLRGKIPDQGVMVISDFHAGKRYGNAMHRGQKRAAIRAMLTMAINRNLEVIFGGDFGDHGSRVTRLEADFEALRSVRDELGFGGQPIFVRGNHDYGFTDQRLEQLTGGCRIHDSLVYYHPKAQVTVCHGHIFGLARTLEVIRTAENVDHLMGLLREDLLDEDLKPSVIAYDIANIIESGLASHGLRGLSTAWEGVFKYRAMLAEQLLRLARNSSESDEATWKMIAGLVGTYDNVEVAAKLGVACGGWASLFGHTHEPLAQSKRINASTAGQPVAQVVGNSGHMSRKRPTCVIAEFPSVAVYQFDPRSQQLRPLHRASLSKSEIDEFAERPDRMCPGLSGPDQAKHLPAIASNTAVSVRPSRERPSDGGHANRDRAAS